MRKIFGVFVLVVLIATLFAAIPMNAGAGSSNTNTQVPFKGDFDGSTVPRVESRYREKQISWGSTLR
jgi:hypothetical protein